MVRVSEDIVMIVIVIIALVILIVILSHTIYYNSIEIALASEWKNDTLYLYIRNNGIVSTWNMDNIMDNISNNLIITHIQILYTPDLGNVVFGTSINVITNVSVNKRLPINSTVNITIYNEQVKILSMIPNKIEACVYIYDSYFEQVHSVCIPLDYNNSTTREEPIVYVRSSVPSIMLYGIVGGVFIVTIFVGEYVIERIYGLEGNEQEVKNSGK